MQTLAHSYDYCSELTRRTAHNFRFSFLTLPKDKRRSMDALYAFNRITDDLGDDPDVPLRLRRTRLIAWKQALRIALDGNSGEGHVPLADTAEVGTFFDHPSQLAIVDTVKKHQIPSEYLYAVIDGVEMDLQPVEVATFDELHRYCYHVAGAVGLCCIHIWGFNNQAAIPLAIDCGLALQLTNILRDITEDTELGRIYLPREDLNTFNYSPDDLRNRVFDNRFRDLMRFQINRAKTYYSRAEHLFDYLEPPGRPILRTMIDIYGGLLKEIERSNFNVFSKRVSLPKWKKLWFAGRAIMRFSAFGFRPAAKPTAHTSSVTGN